MKRLLACFSGLLTFSAGILTIGILYTGSLWELWRAGGAGRFAVLTTVLSAVVCATLVLGIRRQRAFGGPLLCAVIVQVVVDLYALGEHAMSFGAIRSILTIYSGMLVIHAYVGVVITRRWYLAGRDG
jgi:hypothetical protein